MLQPILDRLVSVRIRQQFQRGFAWAAAGLFVSAAIGCGVLVLERAGIIHPSLAPWTILLSLPILGLAAGLLIPPRWQSTAQLVDETYQLKDRTSTAFEFAGNEKQDGIKNLQIDDALHHLRNIEAAKVVPFRLPTIAVPALCMLVVMIGIASLPQQQPPQALTPEPLPVVLEQAELLEDTMLEELEQLTQEQQNEQLQELTEELKQLTEELKQPEVDQREALAKLSEMQHAVNEALRELDVEQIDSQLEQLAEALQATDATQAASQSLKAGNYEQAATELEKIDASTMDRKQRKAVSEDLAKLSKQLGQGKQGELGKAVSEIMKGLENDNMSQCKSGMCKAAGICRKQGLRKKISQCLGCQLNRLSECKGMCQGDRNKPSNKAAKSDSPTQKWGMGASGKPLGEEKTKLDSQRQQENINGFAGEGPSHRETLSTPEARQDAARAYQQRYAEYKKQMEEVIDSEPLPLGHRQTVRNYFESIRPQNGNDVFSDKAISSTD